MSIEKTKQQLLTLVSNDDNPVIALSGRWGTGKTYLWKNIKDKAGESNKKIKDSLYVSLFGLSTVDQIKRKLIEAMIPTSEKNAGVLDTFKAVMKTGFKALSDHYKALAAINDFNLILTAPFLLQNKLIVVDDIERKHEKLGIDEVLGFIDEYSKQYQTSFILILNDNQLSTKDEQKKLWATFREKIIDQEIVLSTTPEEAFDIAIVSNPSRYSEAIRRASIKCNLTNIRIIGKTIKAANQVLQNQELNEDVQARLIPSIVLFSAIHYQGIDDGPDFDFVLNIGHGGLLGYTGENNGLPTPEEKRQSSWRMLIHELGIISCDNFEICLVEFLKSGLVDSDNIMAIIKKYALENEAAKAHKLANDLLKSIIWEHWIDDHQLLEIARLLPPIAGFLDPFIATSLDLNLAHLPGGEEIGQQIINEWITAFKEKGSTSTSDENPFNSPLHPSIQAEFDSVKARKFQDITLYDACMTIIVNRAWGERQRAAMARANTTDFETLIREIKDRENLSRFMRGMINIRLNAESYEPPIRLAADHFVRACRVIANNQGGNRLASMVKRIFSEASLVSDLNSIDDPAHD